MSRLEDHYETVRERNGYDRVSGIDALAGLERRFVAVDDPAGCLADAARPAAADATLVTTGVGMTGPPHLGTVGQILTAVELQRAGLDVQFVLADLEPYHDGADLDRVRALAERYRAFVRELGFDPDRGRLRTQEEARDVMHTAQVLAPYYRPESWDGAPECEPTAWERAVADAYDDADRQAWRSAGPTSEAADTHSALLHAADFLHPLRVGEYDRLVLTFGVDEYGLTRMTREFLATAPVEGRVAGLYTRMLPGFDGGPKMAKSIPGAGVSLADDPDGIRERIRVSGASAGAVDTDESAADAVFQAMCLASRYDAARLDGIEAARAAGTEAWTAAVADYAEFVADLAERWQATA